MRYLSTLIVFAILLVTISACGGGGDNSPTAPTYPTGKPTGLTVESSSQSVTIFWNPVAGATGYYVYMSEDGTKFNRNEGGSITTTRYSIYNLVNGATYYFGVSAVGHGGWESSIAYPGGAPTAVPVIPSEDVGKPPYEGVAPDPPRNLQGIPKDAACEIEWDPPIQLSDFSHYCIYRIASNQGYSVWPMVVTNYTGTSYRDENLLNEVEYSYRITAVDIEPLESDPSNEIRLMPMDFPPELLTNLEIFLNPGRLVLEWDVPLEADIKYYAIERIEVVDPPEVPELVARFLIDKPTHTADDLPHTDPTGMIQWWVDLERQRIVLMDSAVEIEKLYRYRVSAIDMTEQEGAPATVTAPSPVF